MSAEGLEGAFVTLEVPLKHFSPGPARTLLVAEHEPSRAECQLLE